MYKLMCGICALVIGLLLFGAYSVVFANSGYMGVSEKLLQGLLTYSPAVHHYLSSSSWIDLDTVVSLLQSITLSIVFAVIFGYILGVFTGLISVVQYAILGALFGFLYVATPSLLALVNQQFFAGTLSLPVLPKHELLEVVMWYLPLILSVFFTANLRRKKQARAERYWFRD